ncbi:MAG: serine/threonine-protein kinase [Pirellulales bacterium]
MNLHATHAGASAPEKPSAMKFTYPSGARPLEGYTIKRGIGRGGFGEVYYATSDAGKEVALKLIRRNLDVEVRGVSHCLNLKHPNLLSVFDLKRDDQDDTWVVMEYVAGECLEDVLARSPQGMSPEDSLAWMHGILAGVGYLHDHGIVHRDLKPGNIFSDEGVVKIGDYGLSKFISCSRRSGQTESVGTVHYMAPEVANGRYGKEIDIYALGVIFYEMLTGNVPFEGESVGEVLMKHLTAEPDLRQLKEPFRTVVARCLAKDPAQRVNTVQELYALLPPPARQIHFASLPPSPPTPRPAVSGPAVASPMPGASPVAGGEEPVWQAVRGSAGQLQDAWKQSNLHPAARVAIIVGGIILALSFHGPIAALVVSLLVAYGVYLAARMILFNFVKTGGPPTAPPGAAVPMASIVRPPASPAPVAEKSAESEKAARRAPRRRWGQSTLAALPPKTAREKTTELLASMLIAPAIVGVVALVSSLLQGQIALPNQYAWLMIVSTVAAWGVLIPTKLWEGQKKEDAMLRRFTMLVVGLGVGLVAFGVQQALLVDLPAAARAYPGQSPFREWSQSANGLTGYLTYFGFLFLVPRWWKSADPGRRHRLELWSTAAVVFWAWLVGMFWEFPQPWGLMVAAGSCVALQLASPWVDPRTRRQAAAA